jgi:hypothetical protein
VLRRLLAEGRGEDADALRAEVVAIETGVDEAEQNEWFRGQLEGLTEDQLDHLDRRARSSANPYLRSQYADAVLFRRPGAKEIAGVAVSAFVEHAEAVLGAGSDARAIRSLVRAARIAARTKDLNLAKRSEEGMRAAIRTLTAGSRAVWASDLAESAVGLSRLVGDQIVRELKAVIEAALTAEDGQPQLSFDRAKLLLERAVVLRRHLKEPEAARRGSEEMAELYARRAEAEPNPLGKSLNFAEAARLFYRAGRPGRARSMLVRVERNKQALEASLETFEGEIGIPTRWLTRVAAPFLDAPDVATALGRLAHADALLLPVPDPNASAAGRSVIGDLVSVVRLDAGLNMAPVTEERRATVDAADAFQRSLMATAAARTHVLRRLRSERGLSAAAVLDFLAAWNAMPQHRAAFYVSALEAYFRGDQIGFIRGIIPEFEALLRHFADLADIPVIKEAPSGDHQYRSGKDCISLAPVNGALGEALAYYLNMLLYDEDSVGIRDNDAHAIAEAEVYSEFLADALLVLLISLTRVTVTDLAPPASG